MCTLPCQARDTASELYDLFFPRQIGPSRAGVSPKCTHWTITHTLLTRCDESRSPRCVWDVSQSESSESDTYTGSSDTVAQSGPHA